MSGIVKFIRPGITFDSETLAMLGDLNDRACVRCCNGLTGDICEVMADKLIAAAMQGERNPDTSWHIAMRGF